MKKVKAYFRLVNWKWAKPRQIILMNIEEDEDEDEDEDEITEFDSSPYLGWMEKERLY